MKTYHVLSNVKFLKKYSFKFLFVAFLGIHIPLIGLILYLAFGGSNVLTPTSILISVLIFTLLATGATLFILNKLLEPIILTKNSLNNYITSNELPSLPTRYNDEIGILMRETQYTIKTLDDLVEEKKDLIGLMSHDLKNPLSAVISYSEIIPTVDSPEKGEKLKNQITEAAIVQKDIINAVLEMLEQDEVVIIEGMKKPVKVSEVVEEVKSNYSGELDRKNINLNITDDNTVVNVREDLFKQVVSNLISNAIKFSYEDSEIKVSTDTSGEYKTITIIDNGIGFDSAKSSQLFNRFTKYKRKGTSGESTTGLGLYLCKKIIERHSGKIDAVSEGKDKGSEFILYLK